MWWSRFIVVLFAAVALSGCGFHPLYGGGKSGPVASELASVRIAPIKDRVGQELRNHLLDLINPQGRPIDPRYVLEVTLTESRQELAVRKSEIATRANLRLTASYQLLETITGKTVLTGNSLAVSSYNILSQDFATLIAERDARSRAAHEVAEDIRTRLSVWFLQPGHARAGS